MPLRYLKGYEAFTTITDKIWRIFALTQDGIDDAVALHCLAAECEPTICWKGQHWSTM